MNSKEKSEVIKHIRLGTDEVLYYPYNEGKDPLPLRPISSFELDECLYKSLRYSDNKVSDLVIKLKLKLIDLNRNIDVSDVGYAKLLEFYNSIDYWIVYYAMKDFQDEKFSKPDVSKPNSHPKGYYVVLKMDDVHNMADFILNSSHQTQEVIKEIFTDEVGKEVAYYYLYLNVPFSSIKDITKLQRDYLIYSKGNLVKSIRGKAKEQSYSISGETTTLEKFLGRFK